MEYGVAAVVLMFHTKNVNVLTTLYTYRYIYNTVFQDNPLKNEEQSTYDQYDMECGFSLNSARCICKFKTQCFL